MLKYLPLFLHVFFCVSIANAQQHQIVKSEAFDEPGNGYNKVLQMKNGNTLFFHVARKAGIEVNVYNKERKLTATEEMTSDLFDTRKMGKLTIAGLFEINNEAVLFVVEKDGRVPTLYRVRFNAVTGAKVKENEVGSTSKSPLLTFVAETNSIFVEKDPESDCYAVIFFNGFSKDPDDKIKVMHFDGTHKRLSYAIYESPDENFRYLRYIGAVVDGDKRLFLSSYGAANLNGKEGHVFISTLNVGEKTFANKVLQFSEDFKDTKSVMAYNHANNSLQLLTVSYTRGQSSFFGGGSQLQYLSFMSYIDPETLELKSVKPIAGEKINEYAHNTLNTELNYTGLPQHMVINKDNSTTVLSEELRWEIIVTRTNNGTTTQQRTYMGGNGTTTQQYTYMGGIGCNELNPDGTEKSGYWIRKIQKLGGLYPPLYISERISGRWTYMGGYADHNSYMSYDYINTDNNRYIIFNDDDKNFDRDEDEKKRKVAVKVKKLNTICYALNGPGVSKSFLFGDPNDDEISKSLHIDASDFDKTTGTYATIMFH